MHGNRYKWNVQDNDEDDDDDDDEDDDEEENDNEDEANHNLANFAATTFRFCMVIDINEIYRMMMMMMKLIITRPILKLQHPDFAW